MSGTQYIQRNLDITFTLASSGSTTKLSGLRVLASVVKAGGVSMTEAQIRVYGMQLSLMNQLSTLGKPLGMFIPGRNNSVTLDAYATGQQPATVFQGTIREAWADFSAMPDVAFIVSAFGGLLQAYTPSSPVTYNGSVDVATVMQSIAGKMGLTFENNGVSVQLSNPYFPGTPYQQAQAAAQAANINMIVDDGVLAIWPLNGQRSGSSVPLISPSTGLVGYPTFADNGIAVRTLFNPSIKFGANIQVQSSIQPACGNWTVYKVAHTLEAQQPEGAWFTDLACSVIGLPTIA